MKVNVYLTLSNDFRTTLPIKIIRKLNCPIESYIKAELTKNGNFQYLYVRMPSKQPSRKELQIRRKLPREIIENLNLQSLDNVKLSEINIIKKPSPNQLILNNKIDLVALQLNKFMIESFYKNDEEWIRIWNSSKFGGRSNQVEIKRFININRKLGEFLGLMQAESRKYGDKFDFTNILLTEHKLFLDVTSEYFGIDKNSWNLTVFFNKNRLNKKDVEKHEIVFRNSIGLKPEAVYYVPHKTITNICYSISINSNILNSLMNKLLIAFRRFIVTNNDDVHQDCAKGFIIKYLLGDGTASVLSNYKHLEIVLSEQDTVSQKDTSEILKRFNVNSSVNGIKMDISTNIDSCIWFLENGLFIGHNKNRGKFLDYLKNNVRINRIIKRFSTIEDVTISEFSILNNISRNTAHMYLFRNEKLGFVHSYRINRVNFYKLSTKGKRFLNVLKNNLNL